MFTYWRGLYPLGYITECSKNLIFSGQWLMTHKPWRNKGNNIKRKVEFLKLDVIANKTDLCCQRVMIWHENCVGDIHICTDLIWVCKYRLHAEKPFCKFSPELQIRAQNVLLPQPPERPRLSQSHLPGDSPLIKVAAAASLLYVDVKLQSKIKDWHLGLIQLR